MTGDFNFPALNWSTNTISGGCLDTKEQALALLEFISDHCLIQHIDVPTRGNNILDLILTNNEEIIHSITVTDTALSDHKLIIAKSNIYSKQSMEIPLKNTPNIRSFKHLNFFQQTNKLGSNKKQYCDSRLGKQIIKYDSG